MRKRSRIDNEVVDNKQPEYDVRFLLQITREDEDAINYSAPLNCPSVKRVKEAILKAQKIETGWRYENATLQLAACLNNRIGSQCKDHDETVVDADSVSECWTMKGQNVPDFSIDTKDLITDDDLKIWITDKQHPDFYRIENATNVVYQVYIMRGWG